MSRREFSKQVKRAAFERAKGHCEGEPYGKPCGAKLQVGKFHFDHVIPDGLGGEPVIENCAVLCMDQFRCALTGLESVLVSQSERRCHDSGTHHRAPHSPHGPVPADIGRHPCCALLRSVDMDWIKDGSARTTKERDMTATAKEAFMILMLVPAAMFAVGLLAWIFFNDGAVQ